MRAFFFFFSCGALPVVLVLSCVSLFYFFFGATSKRVRQADMRDFFRDVVRAGSPAVAVVVVCFLAVRFLSCVFFVLFCLFYLATSKEGNED